MAKKPPRIVPQLSSHDCVTALRDRYPRGQFALMEQVANATGWAARRWADAVAISLWPSRGLTISGFEIKISRSDWKRELEDPAKSSEVQSFCDDWWIVAPAGLIQVSELPPTWGLIEVDEKKKARIKHQAPKLEAKPLTRSFLAAVLRKHHEAFDDLLKQERYAAVRATEEKYAKVDPDVGRALEQARMRIRALENMVTEFEAASGVSLSGTWPYGRIGEAVKLAMSAEARTDAENRISMQLRAFRSVANSLEQSLSALRSIPEAIQTSEAAE